MALQLIYTNFLLALSNLFVFCMGQQPKYALQYTTSQAMTFLKALERCAAFYEVTSSASKARYKWSEAMKSVSEQNTAPKRQARYVICLFVVIGTTHAMQDDLLMNVDILYTQVIA